MLELFQIWLAVAPSVWLLHHFDMSLSVLECFIAFWHTQIQEHFYCLRPGISCLLKELGFFSWEMVFSNQDLAAWVLIVAGLLLLPRPFVNRARKYIYFIYF